MGYWMGTFIFLSGGIFGVGALVTLNTSGIAKCKYRTCCAGKHWHRLLSSFFPAQPHWRRLEVVMTVATGNSCNDLDKVNYWTSNMLARCQIAFYTFHLPRLSDRDLLLGALVLPHVQCFLHRLKQFIQYPIVVPIQLVSSIQIQDPTKYAFLDLH